MADLLIDVPTLETKASALDTLKGSASKTVEAYSSTSINGLESTELSTIASKVTNSMKRLENGYANSCTWFHCYLNDLNTLEGSLEDFTSDRLTRPIEFLGEFEDIFGKVTMPAIQTNGIPNINYYLFGEGQNALRGGDGTVIGEFASTMYQIANTKGELFDYYNDIIRGKNLYQEYDLRSYSDQCLGFAYNYAWGLYTDNRDVKGADCMNNTSAGNNFKELKTDDESEFLNKVYEEISAGRPVVIQVIGSRKNKTRHYVAAVGFNKNVTSADQLKTTDLLIVDTYDGNMESVVPYGASEGRYVAKGTQINSGRYHYGYDMFYINT